MDDEREETREDEQEEANPAGGMPDHEQADEPGPPVAGDAGGESIRELGAGM
jgi:hypothetical protein